MASITSSYASLVVIVFVIAFTYPCSPCTERIYVGGHQTGISMSTTADGKTWTKPIEALKNSFITSLSAEGKSVYAGIGKGLARSSDEGKTWKFATLFPTPPDFAHTSIYHVDNRVYVVTDLIVDGGTFAISKDGGRTFPVNRHIEFRVHEDRINAVYANGNRSFTGTLGRGVAISDDEGKTWKYVGNPEGFVDTAVGAIAGIGNKIYVAWQYGNDGSISISEDNGETWRVQRTAATQGKYNGVFALAVEQDTLYVGTTNTGVAISRDGGKTWTTKTTADGLPSNMVRQIAASGNNVYVVTAVYEHRGTHSELSISHDRGETWSAPIRYELPFTKDITAIFAHCV